MLLGAANTVFPEEGRQRQTGEAHTGVSEEGAAGKRSPQHSAMIAVHACCPDPGGNPAKHQVVNLLARSRAAHHVCGGAAVATATPVSAKNRSTPHYEARLLARGSHDIFLWILAAGGALAASFRPQSNTHELPVAHTSSFSCGNRVQCSRDSQSRLPNRADLRKSHDACGRVGPLTRTRYLAREHSCHPIERQPSTQTPRPNRCGPHSHRPIQRATRTDDLHPGFLAKPRRSLHPANRLFACPSRGRRSPRSCTGSVCERSP